MHHAVALFSSLASLGIICAIYYCNILSSSGSWLRSEVLAMILLSLLTGLFPLALAATAAGIWQALTGSASLVALFSAGADMSALAAIAISILVLRALIKETYRVKDARGKVAPLSPGSLRAE